MLLNYFKIALRNLLRHKTSSLIKIFSLAIGMICFAIISLFVYHELSFDRFHENPEQVYRIVKDFVNDDGSVIPDATTPPGIGPAVQKELPEAEFTARVFPNWGRKYLFEYEDERSYQEKLIRVDSSFFHVFSFPFVKGDARGIEQQSNSILITESAAKRLFGNQEPLGKTIKIDISKNGTDFQVSGVLKDVPVNSHFSFEFIIPIRSFNVPDLDTRWSWYNFYTYTRLKPNTDPSAFQAKLRALFKKKDPESKNYFYTQALTDIHLKSSLKWELGTNGDASYVKILSVVAIFIILLAAINYINLVTAQASTRAKEVGIRKVTGAHYTSLIKQFLLESILSAALATIISIAIAESILPYFQSLFNASLSFFSKGTFTIWITFLLIALVIGIVAGIYPAFYLSSFQPAKVLKGQVTSGKQGALFRKTLVTFQFVISTLLISGSLIVASQMNYLRNKNMGFQADNTIIIPNAAWLSNRDAVINELQKAEGVIQIGAADGVLGGINWTGDTRAKSVVNYSLLNFLTVDYHFLEVMKVNFKEGRNFDRLHGTDSLGIVLNETAIKQLGIKEPVIGSQVQWGTDEKDNPIYYNVIGMIEDFHFTSFHEPIKPFGFFLSEQNTNKMHIKIQSAEMESTINKLKDTWNRMVPDRPFEYTFQDDQVAKLYQNDIKFQRLFSYFTGIAIIIACLGLFGLSIHTAKQRLKEIGIRKTLGSTVAQIVQLLSIGFLKLVIIAIVIAVPLAWVMGESWLQTFSYRAEISIWVLIGGGLVTVLIALITVSFQSIKAGFTNPVESLKSE